MTTNLNIYCIMAEVEWFHKLLSADKVALVGSSKYRNEFIWVKF